LECNTKHEPKTQKVTQYKFIIFVELLYSIFWGLCLIPFVQNREGCEIPRLTTLIADYFTRNLTPTKNILIQLPEELLHQWLFKEWISYGYFTYSNLMLVANSGFCFD
jgi:hypothetical protein